MSTATRTAVDTCDDICNALQEYALLSQEGLDLTRAFRRSFPSRGPRELVAHLVEHGHLTRFQADTVLRGAAGELILSSYTVLDNLGSGSMGTVYKAKSSKEPGFFAIRTVPKRNIVNLKSIAEKVEALKQVRHPRVSSMVYVGTQADRVYLVWPFVDGGGRLDELVKRQGKLSAKQAAQVGLQVAAGLQAYHAADLFHGLLKPGDVLIGGDRRVRLLDFGVGFLLTCEKGKSVLSTMTNGKALNKGLDCASPESIADPLARTTFGDQYSLGCILYFCLTGQFPFPSNNPVKKMLGHQFEEPVSVRELAPETPPRLVTIVQKLMKKAPEERYSSIDEVIGELQVITSGGKGSQAPAAGMPSRTDGARPGQGLPREEADEQRERKTPPRKVKPKERDEDEEVAPHRKARAEARAEARSIATGVWLSLMGIAAGVVSGVLVWLINRG